MKSYERLVEIDRRLAILETMHRYVLNGSHWDGTTGQDIDFTITMRVDGQDYMCASFDTVTYPIAASLVLIEITDEMNKLGLEKHRLLNPPWWKVW